jgi:hypothetical protein
MEPLDYNTHTEQRLCERCTGVGYDKEAYQYHVTAYQKYGRQMPTRSDIMCRKCSGQGYYAVSIAMPHAFRVDNFDIGYEYEKPKQKETTSMTNYSTAVMLFNENIRAVRIVYEPLSDTHLDEELKAAGVKAKPTQDKYVFKTLDPSIKADDYVVIPTNTRHGLTVVRVAETDVEVDFDNKIEVKWIVAKLDKSEYNNVLVEETRWIDTMKKSEKRAKKEALKKNMMEFVREEEVKALAITHMGDKPK